MGCHMTSSTMTISWEIQTVVIFFLLLSPSLSFHFLLSPPPPSPSFLFPHFSPPQCFGLLGVNGAGKTTTFRMLTGDTRASTGDAVIASHSIRHSLGQVQHSVGYCPQVDALIDPLTGRQHLTLFSKLRGLPAKEVRLLPFYQSLSCS